MKLFDLPSHSWPKLFDLNDPVDRSGQSARDFLESRGAKLVKDMHLADLVLRKAERSLHHPAALTHERMIHETFEATPNLLLIREPREQASAAYRLVDPSSTLAAAPGNDLKRLFPFGTWADPQIDDWHRRLDRICWIGRPTAERVALAKRMIEMGFEIDLYSNDPWPLSAYKGRAENESQTSRKYRYKIIFEASHNGLFHSDKLFQGFKDGCVCFYSADANLHFPFLQGCYLPMDREAVAHRREFASITLANMNSFMHTNAWEVYSLRSFLDQILILANAVQLIHRSQSLQVSGELR